MADVHETTPHYISSGHQAFVEAVDATRYAMQAIGVGVEASEKTGHFETMRACSDNESPAVKVKTDVTEDWTNHRYIITMGGEASKHYRTYKAMLSERVYPDGDAAIIDTRAEIHYPRSDGSVRVVKSLNPVRAMRMGTIIAGRARQHAELLKSRQDDTSEVATEPTTVV